ncbi:DAK2 domain-containing protein [Enterococcus sp. S86.2]|uniref:DAK2 domain-containing protein n=1 Tax=Enterococcus sp. S86.2 TaxID=3031299 RepID=UPI0026F016E2|nr:DegV family protein [Enterococcus sp. S86.2]
MKESERTKLLEGFLNGAKEVVNQKQELNRINVFPVADGDTGSNLAALMQTILDQVSIQTNSIKDGLNQLSEAAMMGARGNSGMIFAQYFYGLSTSYDDALVAEKALVYAAQEASKKAYQAVLEPKEGTILSVMHVWSEHLVEQIEHGNTLIEALTVAKRHTKAALEQTQFQMAVLKKNKLVDAGAKGFYYFIAGLTEYFCNGDVSHYEKMQVDQQEAIEEHFLSEAPRYRYCSEFLVKQLTIEFDTFKAQLAHYGDSLVLIGDQTQVKIHIHTSEPARLMSYLVSNGQVTYQKVDDMQLQYQIGQNAKAKIAIVTDSIADLPKDFSLEHQVHVLPMNLLLDEETFLDKLTIEPDYLQQRLKIAKSMSTAQPNIKTVDALLSFLEGKYDHVLVISVAAKLSGTYQLITQRIKEKQLSSNWIQVIDSKLNSIAQGLLVKRAVELVEADKSFETVVNELQSLRERIFIYVAVADLDPMIQSGRIPQFLGKIAQKASVHPIVSLNEEGDGKLIGASLSQKQSLKKITKKVSGFANKQRLEAVYVTHVFNEQAALDWKTSLNARAIPVDAIVESSAAIAISAGQSSLAIAGVLKEEEK